MATREEIIKALERKRLIDGLSEIQANEKEKSPLDVASSMVTDPLVDFGSKIGGAVERGAKMLDPITGAPVRAVVGGLQMGMTPQEAGALAVGQFKQSLPQVTPQGTFEPGPILPGIPTGREIVTSGARASGIAEPFAQKTGEIVGPFAEAGMDLTMAIPGEPALDALAAGGELASAGLRGLGRGVKAIPGVKATGRALVRSADFGAKKFLQAGEFLTQRTLDAEKGMRAFKELNSVELIFPRLSGQLSKASAELAAIRAANVANPVAVPGGREALDEVKYLISSTQQRLAADPAGSSQVLQKIHDITHDKVTVPNTQTESVLDPHTMTYKKVDKTTYQTIEVPRDPNLDEMDDLIQIIDNLQYTGMGNPRMLKKIWGPAIKKSRVMVDNALQVIEPGQLFKEKKARVEALLTAGKTRSKLFEGFGLMGTAMGTTLSVVQTGTINGASFLARFMSPQFYMEALGAAKMPADIARGLVRAFNTKSPSMIRDVLTLAAKKAPGSTERFIRGIVLASGKPDGSGIDQQEINDSIDGTIVSDPDEIKARVQSIRNNKSIGAIEKAKQISEIGRKSYYAIPRPDPEPEAEQESEYSSPNSLDDLLKAIGG